MQAELFAPRQGRILVVDDTSANIQAVTAILREHGYQISVATNGRQALSVLERVRPDLILLDVLMPEMDGFEACRRIKHNPDLSGHPHHLPDRQDRRDRHRAGIRAGRGGLCAQAVQRL